MNFLKKIFNTIHPLLFMLSFCIGLFFTYSLTSAPEVLYIYPNPHNLQDTIYKDDSDKCFKYTSEKVECTDDAIFVEDSNQNNKESEDIDDLNEPDDTDSQYALY
jgi:hypothetical protein